GGCRYLLVASLSAIKPSRICCLTLSSCSVVMLSIAPSLNRRQAVLEGVHVARREALAFQSFHSFLPTWQDSFSHSCLLTVRRATRIRSPRVLWFDPAAVLFAVFRARSETGIDR